MTRLLRPLCCLALALGGCTDSSRVQQPAKPAAAVPSFKTQIQPLLTQSCASARGCHGESPVDWIEMDLREGKAYAALVNAPADNRANALRVKPFSPADSFLIDKLQGTLRAREGKPMPLDARTNRPTHEGMPPDFVAKTLEPWILAGAPDN